MFSIKKILILTQSTVLIILTILLAVSCYQYYGKTTLEIISGSKQQSLRLISEKLDSVVDSAKTISDLISKDDEIVGTMYSDNLEMINVAQAKSNIDTIYIKYFQSFQQIGISFYVVCIGENGFEYCSRSGYSHRDFQNIRSYSWFNKNIANKTSYYLIPNFVDSAANSATESNSLAVIRNIYNSEQQYIGSVLVCIPEMTLENTYNAMATSNADLYIIDELSIVISSTNKDTIGEIPFPSSDYTFTRNAEDYNIYTRDTEKYYGAKFKSGNTGWTVYEQTPLSIILEPLDSLLRGTILLAILGCLFCILVSTVIANKISQPIYEFSLKIQNAASNGLHSIRTPSRLKELDSLDRCFDSMQIELTEWIERNRQREKDINTAKYNFLRAQINPHFLYNTLFSIKCMVSMNHPKQACEMIEILISLLRYSISKNDSYITLLDECTYLSQYVKLQNLRYNERICLELDLSDDILDIKIPRFILQPVIENSILHGMPDNSCLNVIHLSFSLHGKSLLITITDSGPGIDKLIFERILNSNSYEADNQDVSHIGLNNIQNRIILNYGEVYGLLLQEDAVGRNHLAIHLPVIRNIDELKEL